MEDLRFLSNMPAAFDSAGANKPPHDGPNRGQKRTAIPTKLQIHAQRPFSFLRELFDPPAGVGGLTTIALPTISISESPGIHSTAMHAREGALPGEK